MAPFGYSEPLGGLSLVSIIGVYGVIYSSLDGLITLVLDEDRENL